MLLNSQKNFTTLRCVNFIFNFSYLATHFIKPVKFRNLNIFMHIGIICSFMNLCKIMKIILFLKLYRKIYDFMNISEIAFQINFCF